MNILILGSSGQIGSALCDYYTKKGFGVEEFDIMESDFEDLRIPHNPMLEAKLHRSDFVFFLAYDIGGSRYLKENQNTFDYVDNNMKIMVNTFNAIKEYNKPFVFASSQMSNMDWSSYGSLKRVGEHYTKTLGGVVTRFWNVYGVEKRDESRYGVVTDFLMKAAKTGKIDMITDGTETREFLYADDACEALDTIRLNYHNIDRDRDLCVTSFEETSILEVAQEVSRLFGASVCPSTSKDEVQKNSRNVADKYIQDFWKPKTSLREGIGRVALAHDLIQPDYETTK